MKPAPFKEKEKVSQLGLEDLTWPQPHPAPLGSSRAKSYQATSVLDLTGAPAAERQQLPAARVQNMVESLSREDRAKAAVGQEMFSYH